MPPATFPTARWCSCGKRAVLFAGDNVFNDFLPWLHQSDPFGWLESLQWIRRATPKVIVPGHGPVCDMGPVDRLEDYLKETLALVRKTVDDGLSRQEAANQIRLPQVYPVPEHFRSVAPAVEKMGVERLYDALSEINGVGFD